MTSSYHRPSPGKQQDHVSAATVNRALHKHLSCEDNNRVELSGLEALTSCMPVSLGGSTARAAQVVIQVASVTGPARQSVASAGRP